MADKPEAPTPPPPPIPSVEQWSAISQGDLGLKAVYWEDAAKTSITSRSIVGWITWTNRKLPDVVPFNGFAAIVIGDNWMPAAAQNLPGYACIAPNGATEEEIIARLREWGAAPNPPPNAFN